MTQRTKMEEVVSDRQQQRRRSIRSFVKRAGRMTPGQERALRDLWPEFGIEYSEALLDLNPVFGRTAPRVLEIGFGNGETLVEQACANPAIDYIGIEVHEPGVGHCLLHIEEAGISNVRLLSHDAVEVLQAQIPDGEQSRINLYFPDPWPKKRHHKRRLVQPAFLELAAQKIEAVGAFHLATDWEDYAEHIDALIGSQKCFRLTERRVHCGDNPLDRPMTKFEKRGLQLGHKIWDWQLTRL